MSQPAVTTGTQFHSRLDSARFGRYLALAITAITILTFVIAFLTPPLSGPFCTAGCYSYPYADIASRFPRDYYWMYPAMVLQIVYAVLLICIHRVAGSERSILSGAGLFFGLFASAVLFADFFIQVSIIPPSLAKGEMDGISLLSQFNPHGLFIVLEELGYLLSGISFLFLAPVFSGTGLQRALRYSLLSAGLLLIASFIYFSVAYGLQREYRFEVAAISITWFAFILLGILLSRYFKQALSNTNQST